MMSFVMEVAYITCSMRVIAFKLFIAKVVILRSRFNFVTYFAEGGLSQDEKRTLLTQSENKLSPAVKAQFEDAMSLFTTRSEVEAVNLSHLVALNQTCAWIMARHDGGSAAIKLEADKAGGMESYVVPARGAKVILTRNICQELGLEISKAFSGFRLPVRNFGTILNLNLVNATTGILEDIIWAPDFTRSELPTIAFVSCPTYTGPTLWYSEPREGFPNGIPIVSLKTTFEINGQTMSRTQLLLRLAWAVTVHKSQGLTLPKIKLGLGKREFSTGLTFVALSRVKDLDDIMFVDQLEFDWIFCSN